jgi:hypothetical protein
VQTSYQHVADAAWIDLAAGNADAAGRRLAGVSEALRTAPEVFDAGFVQLAAVSAEVAVRRKESATALTHATAALNHLRDKTDAGALPFLEARALKAYGDALLASDRTEEAAAQLEPAVALMRRLHSPDSPWLLDALASLSVARSRQEEPEEASTLAGEARGIARRNNSLPALFSERLTEAEQLLR